MRARIALIALLVASSALAADLGKYKEWSNSPQSYFMTNSERAEWSKVQTEADAEQFVNKFLASRGPGFADDVADRARAADDHLSVAGKKGSATLRGKIIILLGPPKSFSVAQRKSMQHNSLTTGGAVGSAAPGGGGGKYGTIGSSDNAMNPAAMADAANQSEMSAKFVNDYTFTYAKEALPGKLDKDLVIVVEVNPATGDDRIVDSRMARQVNELLEAAADTRAAKR